MVRERLRFGLLTALIAVAGCTGDDACDIPGSGMTFVLSWGEEDLDLAMGTPAGGWIANPDQRTTACRHICGDGTSGGEEAIHCTEVSIGVHNISIENAFAGSVAYMLEIIRDGEVINVRNGNVPGNDEVIEVYTAT